MWIIIFGEGRRPVVTVHIGSQAVPEILVDRRDEPPLVLVADRSGTVMIWEATQDEPMSNTVVLTCRYIDEHQDLIRPTFQAENDAVRAAAIAKAEAG
jgi:hypothetical protein